jgi:hypothetical protein
MQARLLWDARYDASVLPVEALAAARTEAGIFDPARLWPLMTIVAHPGGHEYVALSDGHRRIRLDVIRGTLRDGPVHLRYKLAGLTELEAKILTLRRLLALYGLGRFARYLHPSDRFAPRWVAALRAYDAVGQGASQRDIAMTLYGDRSTALGRENGSDFLRLRVQRLVRMGRYMVAGGYLTLLR